MLSYSHPKTWGLAYFDPKSIILKKLLFDHENIKKQLSKEVTFSKIEKISLTAKAAHMTQNWKSILRIGLRNSLLYLLCDNGGEESNCPKENCIAIHYGFRIGFQKVFTWQLK